VPVLYTSMMRDGAWAEVVSYLTLLTPLPLSRPLKVSRLGVSTRKTLRLARVGLERLGVDMAQYGENAIMSVPRTLARRSHFSGSMG
jgi:hypothetical protein